jgi:hypothetical protein
MPGILYYIAITSDEGQKLYKIGVTNHSVEHRFPDIDNERIKILKLWRFKRGEEAENIEKDILIEFNEFKYKGPKITRRGNTEIFTKDILNLDNGTEVNLHDDLPIFNRKQKELNLINRN